MDRQDVFIDGIPALILGERSDKVYLFVHGQGGSREEAVRFAEIAALYGWQTVGIDLPEHGGRADGKAFLPWEVVPELKKVERFLKKNWRRVALRANSIGAWFSLLAFEHSELEQSLFVSPVLDMHALILDMMRFTGVSEERLRQEKVIATGAGPVLSWEYLEYVRQHPVREWKIPTEILYAERDEMIARETVERFAEQFGGGLTVVPGGEHWFHTEEQLRTLGAWEDANMRL